VRPDPAVAFTQRGGSHRGEGRTTQSPGRRSFTVVDEEAEVILRPFDARYDANVSPRHRHPYDQIRFILQGEVTYGIKSYPKGTLAYFPESVHYGPKNSAKEGARVLTLQLPGPSHSPVFTLEQEHEATEKLRALGVTFPKGIAHWPDGKLQDSSEAAYEYLAGGKIDYPPARFNDSIFMYSPNYPWRATKHPGITIKHFANFTETGPNVFMLHFEPGATTPRGSVGFYQVRWVIEGEAEYAGQQCPAVSFLYYPPGAPYEEMVSPTGGTVLVIQAQPPAGGDAPVGNVI
jgi:hypothetical protein